MLNDYFNLDDEKEDKKFLFPYTYFFGNNILNVDVFPKEYKKKDEIIDRKFSDRKNVIKK